MIEITLFIICIVYLFKTYQTQRKTQEILDRMEQDILDEYTVEEIGALFKRAKERVDRNFIIDVLCEAEGIIYEE